MPLRNVADRHNRGYLQTKSRRMGHWATIESDLGGTMDEQAEL